MSPLLPLQHPTFRNMWTANLASGFGALIQGVGAAWLMTSISNSVDMVALVQASTSLPIMLFSMVGGAIADSFHRRKVMLAAQSFMLIVSATLMAFTYFGLITPWLLLAFTFLIGCGAAINNPSWQASVGDLVPRTDLPGAVALNSIGFNLSRSVGPAVGGVIVAAAGAAAAFAVNTVSYLPVLLVLFLWKPNVVDNPLPRESIGPAIASGFRYVAMSPGIGKVLLRSFVFGFSAIVILALLPVVSANLPGGGPLIYGLLLGAFGLGAVGGALLAAPLQERLGGEMLVRASFLGFAICAGITALGISPWLTGAGLLLGGACWVLALSLFNVSVQLASPRWVVGRALSFYQTATFGGMALGSWIWGVAAENYGLPIALGTAAVAMLVGIALGFRFPLPPRVVMDLAPLNRFQVPHLEIDLEPRSGPIVVEITYIIRTEDIPVFLNTMTERRRIRRRDGARHWALLRDLAQPDRWVETYQSPTWTDYVRHNLRLTKADAEVSERLRALHAGEEPPAVRRYVERPTDWLTAVAKPKPTIAPP
ncbi:ABC transporter permease [Devosia sp. H5989]|uniref:MFS transporter n=1 Tax=Paradevosia tibetensis TaxID=1447062 RepID=A0A5B9DUN3_9HYPH|nr:MFS transporter [Youhaiella tibetensis]AKR55490.1 ABC transporter permease [Devosia sp. H5989]QEE22772.1 MFS transporter [Youhaiella tibetensis]